MGYDVPLSDMLRSDAGKKVLSVPFLTGYKDLAADRVELTIILPEGAKYVSCLLSMIELMNRDVEVHTPFAVDSVSHSIHKTYLDTTGRHAITITKQKCTEHHAQPVYVSCLPPSCTNEAD
jgi:oligosaccharyltransferase complex subunit alpha (ribophorin I)